MKFKDSWRKIPGWVKGGVIAIIIIYFLALLEYLWSSHASVFYLAFYLTPSVLILGGLIGRVLSIKKPKWRGFFLGLIVGFFVLSAEFGFGLIIDNPPTTIIDAFCRVFGSEFFLFAVLIIFFLPAIIGLIIGLIVEKVRAKKSEEN
jgi:hypothetical protein